jgi:hypothetical protein
MIKTRRVEVVRYLVNMGAMIGVYESLEYLHTW